MIVKKGLAVLAAAAVLACATVAGAEGIRVAVVDVAKVLNGSEAGKTARKNLEGRFEELRKGVEAKREEARKAKEELDALKVLYDKGKGKEKLKVKEDALQGKAEEYQKAVQEAEKEMRGKEQEMSRSIQKIIEEKVNAIVQEEKIDLLLDAQQGGTVLHFAQAMDLTAKVLERVNAETSGEKAVAK
jgi:Skp family chaperone for outer membrane proteins